MAGLIAAAAISLGWAILAVRLGPRIGFVDEPDDPSLKVHRRPAVPLGGVGIFLGVQGGALLEARLDMGLLAASGIVLVLGLVDDRRSISPQVRLVVEAVSGVVLMAGLAATSSVEPLGWILGVGLVVLSVNAVNLFDGLDALAGSAALVAAAGIALLAAGRGLDSTLPALLAAAVGGFLILNWHPARIFFGDAGAYVVGVMLAHGVLASGPAGSLETLVGAGVLGVFAIDLVVTLLRRKLNGRPLFAGDRSHVYDQLRDRGLSIPTIALGSAVLQAILVAIVVLVDRVFPPLTGVGVLTLLFVLVVGALARGGFLRVDQQPG